MHFMYRSPKFAPQMAPLILSDHSVGACLGCTIGGGEAFGSGGVRILCDGGDAGKSEESGFDLGAQAGGKKIDAQHNGQDIAFAFA